MLEFLGNIKIRKKISYIQKVNFSKLFDRLCNLSNILNVKKNIYCVRLTKLGRNKFKKDKKKLINRLSKDLYIFLNKKLDKSIFKTRYKAHFYETSYRNKIQLKNLKSYVKKNSCKLVNTSEIITYISQNLARFKTL